MVEKGIGNMIANSPVGNAVRVDDALIDASEDAEGESSNKVQSITERLEDARETGSVQFIRNIEAVDRLCNHPSMLLTDGEILFLLPVK
ncbi:MAG: hypothetical protein ACOYIK_08995 [Coriobacteriales bacterium]|jgi:hypothetical protein